MAEYDATAARDSAVEPDEMSATSAGAGRPERRSTPFSHGLVRPDPAPDDTTDELAAETATEAPAAAPGAPATVPGVPAAGGEAPEPLLGTAGPQLHSRWQQVLASFVDDPRGAVREADALLEETTALLTSRLDERRRALHAAWQDEAGSSTEDLRLALRSYRGVIQHLLEA